jgi:mannose-6-phosphate isomerase-like protein (cupin superfamily)
MTDTNTPRPARRIITGGGPDGRSRIVSDAPAPISRTVPERPGYLVSNLWAMTLAGGSQAEDLAPTLPGILPPSGGSVLRVIDFPPEAADPESRKRMMEATFGGIFADADHRGGKHPGMHVTRTVDYAIVLEGEIYAVLDEQETLMRAGDILIQRGTSHAWANRSKASARIAFILIDTP